MRIQDGLALGVLLTLLLLPATAANAGPLPNDVIHHEAVVQIDASAGTLTVVDKLTLSDALFAGRTIDLLVPAGLKASAEGAELSTTTAPGSVSDHPHAVAGQKLTLKPAAKTFTLRYEGKLVDQPQPMAGEHQRAFSTSSGIISTEGVYLPWWLPTLAEGRVTFDVRVEGLDAGWKVMLPGSSRPDGTEGAISKNAFAEVPLVAGAFHRESRSVDGVEVLTLLRKPDAALSARYLDVTGQYLKLYGELIGPFPYTRFALVENFWETGYGMPGFTLLGPKVIRFPFILHSSYPHELLHNYFGNGVFLPEGEGNWCEGLTAYLADHLVAEQRGKGAEHRLSLLTRYRDFVTEKNDFPVRRFKGRSSPSTEAVGYGKWTMVLHMLRVQIGDDAFRQAVRDFFAKHQFERASFRDFQKAAEFASGQSLERFFTAWLDRKGAPTLRWTDAQAYKPAKKPWSVSLTLRQTQRGGAYPMSVPVAITLDDGHVHEDVVAFRSSKVAKATLEVPGRPVRIDVDPAFETFRVPHRDEVPPRLSSALGDGKQLFVVSEWASAEAKAAWQAFAKAVCPSPEKCTFVVDKDVKIVPSDASVWLLGYANLLRAGAFVQAKAQGASFDDNWLKLGERRVPNSQHSIVLALRSPTNADKSLVFVGADRAAAIAGLARKIPHYGKYGYLAFTGDEPTNVVKGQWKPQKSPLSVKLHPLAEGPGRRKARAALAELPPPFDAARMQALVGKLAAPELAGRGYGSPGLEKAALLIESEMKVAGLAPGGTEGYRQCFDDAAGPAGATRSCNLVGRIPGRDPAAAAIVVGAHYDHLGTGWPADALRSGNAGKVHPGANDNASGVAVMLEVARALSAAGGGQRSILVVAFTGEEAGLRGSRHFVGALGEQPGAKVHSAVVLDTVGHRTDKAFIVLGQESAREWVHAFHGVGFVTGVDVAMGAPGLTASDHGAFIEKGIPAVQLFSGAAGEYHSPQDVPAVVVDKDLADAAHITQELLMWLVDVPKPLQGGAAAGKDKPKAHSGGGRRVQTGAVPDFKFPGPGVRLSTVLDDSPLKAAGLRGGDVLLEMDGRAIRDLRTYSLLLRRAEPGQVVKLKAQRGDEILEVQITLRAR